MRLTRVPLLVKGFKTLSLAVVILAISFGAAGASRFNQVEKPLFVDTSLRGPVNRAGDPTIVRGRNVSVNFDVLDRARPGRSLELNLFEDAPFQAVIDERSNLAGRTTWIGHIEGIDFSQVTLVVGDGQMAGNIAMPDAFYQVRYAGAGIHAIYQIDQSAFPEELEPIGIETPAVEGDTAALPTGPTEDDGSIIDVMVAYTPAARSAEGGTTAIQNLVTLAVVEANVSYANSSIAQRLNLVHMTEVAYSESGDMGVDLSRLRSDVDGYMDNLHNLRDDYYADVVSLIVEGGQYCGIAYMMSTVSTSFASWAFSVVARTCATGYYSFAHELGHNMGARHDWYVDNTKNSPYTYNHAYVYPADRWRTIMAYNQECSDRGYNCTRLQYWSNPNITYGGVPMGVPPGTSDACILYDLNHPDCDAANNLTLDNTAYTVANFRPRPPTPTQFPFYDGFESGSLGDGWHTITDEQGRVQVSDQYPYGGTYSVLLDDTNGDGTSSTGALVLTIDLSGQSEVELEFWWREWADENDPEDGLFISDDYGITWHLVTSFNDGLEEYQHEQIDLDAAASGNSLELNDHFQIKFQFYDNYPIPSDGYAIDEVSLYVPVPPSAGFPFYDGFESGSLDEGWHTITDEQGRVQVSDYAPYVGSYSALLDDTTGDGTHSTGALVLTIDLSSQSEVELDFWWREWSDEDDPQDGLFISDDYGDTWHLVTSFNSGPEEYQLEQIDLDAAASDNSLALNDHFQIKFQFYDNDPIPDDGYAIDEVSLYVPPSWDEHSVFIPIVIK